MQKAAVFTILMSATALFAATFTPTSVAELIDNINTANENDQDDIIDLSQGSPFVLITFDNGSPIGGFNGLPVIEPDNGHSLLVTNGIINRMSDSSFRFFEVSADANLSLQNVTLQNGDAGSGNPGGAILVDGLLNTVSGCTFLQNHAQVGGVIAARAPAGSVGSIVNSTFDSNNADAAGAAIAIFGSMGFVRYCAFTSNRAHVAGAIFINLDAEVAGVFDTDFSNNAATSGSGGAIFVAGHLAVIDNVVFARNAGLNGGALAVSDAQSPVGSPPGTVDRVENSLFLGNRASAFGGAIAGASRALTRPQVIGEIRRLRFINNTGFQGGAFSLVGSSLNVLDTSTFSSNSAFVSGGAIFLGSSSIGKLENSTFNNNSTTGQNSDGGVIFMDSEFDVPCSIDSIDNSTFFGNQATGNGGVLSMSTESGPDSVFITNFSNNTVASNSAAGSGGGFNLPFLNSIHTLVSTIVAKNTAVVAGPDVSDIPGAVTTEHANLIGNNSGSDFIAGRPNLNGSFVGTALDPIDPLLGPLAHNGGPTETMALLKGSFAIDNGANPLNLLFDQRGPGFPRESREGTTDIGAFERQEGCPQCPDCPDRERDRRREHEDHNGNVGPSPGSGFMLTPPPVAPPVAPPPPALAPVAAPLPAVTPAANLPATALNIDNAASTNTPNEPAGCSSISAPGNNYLFLLLLALLMGLRIMPRRKRNSI